MSGQNSFNKLILSVATLALLFIALGFENGPTVAATGKTGAHAMKIEISSTVFQQGHQIPIMYTSDGKDISPPLRWTAATEGVRCFALICDDPDAPMGTWVHWVIYNIPQFINKFGEGISTKEELSDGSIQGKNSWKKIGYGGPSPPPGKPHRYFFKIYALDTAMTTLGPGATKEQLLAAMKGHILGEAELMGTYGR